MILDLPKPLIDWRYWISCVTFSGTVAVMFLGGDFNCIENPNLYRNHREPHPASSHRPRELTVAHERVGIWRTFHQHHRHTPGVTARAMFCLWRGSTAAILLGTPWAFLIAVRLAQLASLIGSGLIHCSYVPIGVSILPCFVIGLLEQLFRTTFYTSLMSVWLLLRKQKETEKQREAPSVYWLLQEPVLFESFLVGPTLISLIQAGRVFSLGQAVELDGPRLGDLVGLAARMELISTGIISRRNWKQKLTTQEWWYLWMILRNWKSWLRRTSLWTIRSSRCLFSTQAHRVTISNIPSS